MLMNSEGIKTDNIYSSLETFKVSSNFFFHVTLTVLKRKTNEY